jgi:O-methyltransferase domain
VAKTSWKNWKAPDKRGEQMSAAMVSTHGVMEGEGAATNAQAAPAHVQLIQMPTSCWIFQIVSTAANVCIADHLAGGPKSASEIAEAVRCNPRALHRFMRALANFGIVKSAGNQKFALTPLGEALKSGAPGAAWSTVLMTAGPLVWKCFEQLQYSVGKSMPDGGDACILSHIIHDWSEEQCLTILSNCRKAMTPGSKLLIVEFVLPEGDEPHIGKLLDMTMLAVTGGEERTAIEYKVLLARAGLKINRVIPTGSDVSIVEAELLNH